MTAADLYARVRSLVVAPPFGLTETPEPFTFDRLAAQVPTDSVRVELRQVGVSAGFAFSEEHFADVDVWVAAPTTGDARATQTALLTLANSLSAAIVRDGAGVWEFAVLDEGRRVDVEQPEGAAYQVLRLTLPVSYMLTV